MCVDYHADQFISCPSRYSTTCDDRVIFAKWG
ncbi:hypothetical protein TIFTF001_055725 [Ficus carica]|uniref:Uncharacterized protein n=1 Tax=Ficus carica TaxID=3494 RepID=A0AA88JIH7_FICCA|nr:hypothetical protein TIFTF001_055725 [Ficus carica]